MIKVLSEETRESIENLFNTSESSIRIVSPFLSVKTTQMLCDICKQKPFIDCSVITRIYINDLLNGVNSIDAIELLLNAGIKVYSLQALHAKLYLFDESTVILGSANFTMAGLSTNYELSILTDDSNVTSSASIIVENLEQHCINSDGTVTNEMLSEVKEAYEVAYKKRQKDYGYYTLKMFGADRIIQSGSIKNEDWKKDEILVVEDDPVYELLSDEKKKEMFHHKIWAKFEGRSDDRNPGNEKSEMAKVFFDGQERYIVNFSGRPSGIETGDRVFIVSLTTDEDGKPATRIVGRGTARSFIHKCKVQQEWLRDYPWMKRYSYFCEVYDVELLNINRKDCIPLKQVYDVLDKNTYTCTIDKDVVKNMSLCQCRRSHIEMTLDAKNYIDSEIDRLAHIHGFISL